MIPVCIGNCIFGTKTSGLNSTDGLHYEFLEVKSSKGVLKKSPDRRLSIHPHLKKFHFVV